MEHKMRATAAVESAGTGSYVVMEKQNRRWVIAKELECGFREPSRS